MPAETARVFFALWPPAGLADELAALARQIGQGRPSRSETIHLTLAFLGNVPVDRLEALKAVAAGIEAPAFELQLDHVGYWAHKHLAWAGCAPEPTLQRLVDQLASGLENAGFAAATEATAGPGSDRKNRVFSPHVTLLRKLAGKPVLPARPKLSRWPCQGFVLVRSRLSAAGPAYETIGEFALHT